MGRIITIARQFGSGGRELGRRLAENLGIEYYDREIVSAIAEHTQLSLDYVKGVVENRAHSLYPISFGHSLTFYQSDMMKNTVDIFKAQREIIEEMARKSDCVMVGRCADYILRDMKPFRIFVYASMESRIAHCRARDGEEVQKTDAQYKKLIKSVDKHRADYYEFYTCQEWGKPENYDLCINTSFADIKEISKAVAMMVKPQ